MAKSKSKIPVRRPFSDERNKYSHHTDDPSDLRRISSDLSKPKNRNNENDESSVHSLDVNSTNLRVRRFTVTIKDSQGTFVKRRKSYKLTYDNDRDGGDEFRIEKESVSDTSEIPRQVNDIQDNFQDLSNEDFATVFSEDQTQKDNDNSGLTAPVNSPLLETETSQTIFTDDTSLPTFDDESCDTQNREDSVSLQNSSPVSGTVIRLLTPRDRNETNILFQERPNRNIAKVTKADPFESADTGTDNRSMTNETEFKAKATQVSKEATNVSIPPKNFKANLFNRVRKVSTPRRTPKFSPILDPFINDKTDNGKTPPNEKERTETRQHTQKPNLRPGLAESTFVKEPSSNRFVRVASSESMRSHYDKNLKRVSDGDNLSMAKNNREKDKAINLDKAVFALKPKRHRRSLETTKSDGRTVMSKDIPNDGVGVQAHKNQNSGILTRSAIFNKPVLKQPAKVVQHKSQDSKLLRSNYHIENSKNDIFSEQDKKSRLKHAQYINNDLRIVKTKLQDSEFIAQHLDSKLRETIQKKNVLSNLNKNTAKREPEAKKTPISQKILAAQTFNKLYTRPEKEQPHNYKSDTVEKLDNHQTNELNVQNENQLHSFVPDVKTNSNKGLEHKPDVWQVQPKIHRFNSNKVSNVEKKTENASLKHHPGATSSVAAWVLHSAKGANRKQRAPRSLQMNKALLQSRRKRVNKKWKLIQTREIQRIEKERKKMERKDSKSTEATAEVSENLINTGMYMPLGLKRLKRRPKRLRPRLYTQVGKVKGYESEIPVLYNSDDEAVYLDQRPLTDTADKRYPFRRYEGETEHIRTKYRDPAHTNVGRSTGALVKIYQNGETNDKGLPVTINMKYFPNFETLLNYLNEKIPTMPNYKPHAKGFQHIFQWPDGREITSITEFKNRCVYVISRTRELIRYKKNKEVKYGESREGYFSNEVPAAGKNRKNESELYQKQKYHKESPVRSSPMVITIINNLSRDRREKIILNPQTRQDFEGWLQDIAHPFRPIKTLYSDTYPYKQVKSFTHLFREHQANCSFIACGDELRPLELMKKRQAPSSNSSTDSISESKYGKKKLQKQNDMAQIYENGRPDSPTSTAMSRNDTGARYNQSSIRGRPKDSRQARKGAPPEKCVQIEVDGVFKDFYPPSYNDPNDDGVKPNCMLRCEWVYGFRGNDTRDNLKMLHQTGEMVYYVAAVVVLYHKEYDTQRHYINHNEEITCMAIHPNQYVVATGQMHGKEPDHAAHIRIWDGCSLSTLSVIGLGVFFGGILSVGFSQDKAGVLLCALDGSEKHVLSVWDWQMERVVARTTTTTDAVHGVCFYPDGPNNSILITYGERHIYFWKIFHDIAHRREAKILRDLKSGVFQNEVPKYITCIAFLSSGDVVTGDTSGSLVVWERDLKDAFTLKDVYQLHDGEITSLCVNDDNILLSASMNEIKAWDTNNWFRLVKARQIPPAAGDIISLVTHVQGGADGRLYVGTNKNAILDGTLQHKFKYVVQGHCDKVTCVIPQEHEPTFFSAGLDHVIFKWGMTNHKVIWRKQVDEPCTSLASLKSKSFDIVVVGTETGNVHILHAFNGINITTVKVGEESIGCLAFSHVSHLHTTNVVDLAVGCSDGCISVYRMPDRKTFDKLKSSSTGHKTGVANLDWSKDGRVIESSSYDNDIMFWNMDEKDSIDPIEVPVSMRNVEWSTINSPMSYNLIGPWSVLDRKEVIKVVCRSPNRDLCVTGDSKGKVRLFKYPCTKERTDCRCIRIYSSEVTAVAFSADNCSVFTSGGNDPALVQWEIVEGEDMYMYNR